MKNEATLTETGTAGDTVDVDFDNDGMIDGTTTIDSTGDWSLAPSGLADGQYTAAVTVKDVAGNPAATASVEFILDTTAPVVTAFTPEQDAILAASPNTATVTFSEAVDLGLLPLDQSVNVTAASGENVAQTVALGDNDVVITFNQQLAAGQYTTTALVAQTPDDRGTPGVRDLAGNALDDTQSEHPAHASWTVDTASGLPTVRIEATDDTATEGDNQDNAAFTISVAGEFDGQLTVQFRVSADSTAEFQQIDHQKPDFKLTGVDFDRQNNLGTATFFAGSTRSATITLKANRDNVDEETETAILELIQSSDYEVAADAATAVAFLQDTTKDTGPKVTFLTSQNSAIDPKTQALNVSNWETTRDLPEPLGLPAEFGARNVDPDNFRIEVVDPNGGVLVEVKLEVIRNKKVVYSEEYVATKGNDPGKYRTGFLRLVSDAVDDAASGAGAKNDPSHQTILAKLGDQVKVTYGTGKGAVTQTLEVGRPAKENDNGADQSKHDIREIKINITVFAAPGTTKLAEAVNANDKKIVLENVADIQDSGYIKIGDEFIEYKSVDRKKKTLNGITRTGAHNAGSDVLYSTNKPAASFQDVLKDLAFVDERYAQVAVRVAGQRDAAGNLTGKGKGLSIDMGKKGTGVALPPALLDGFTSQIGVDEIRQFTDDEISVINLKDKDPNSVDVFYVADPILPAVHDAAAVAYFKARNLSDVHKDSGHNFVVIGSVHSITTLAHEFAHILLNSAHRDDPSTHLLRDIGRPEPDVLGRRRLGPYHTAEPRFVNPVQPADTKTIRDRVGNLEL